MNKEILYNIILLKSRNYKLYNQFKIKDDLKNKIIIFLIHFSFIFNRLKNLNSNKNQQIFDYIFSNIEIDLRELGYGDMSVNKKMKIIVNKFYSILLDFKNYKYMSNEKKIMLLKKLINYKNNSKLNDLSLVNYFNKFTKNIDLISTDDIYNGNF